MPNMPNNTKPVVNPEGKDWRTPFLEDLVRRAKRENFNPQSLEFQQQVMRLFFECARDEEFNIPESQRLGYVLATQRYKDPKAYTQMVSLVRKRWDTIDANSISVVIPKSPILVAVEKAALSSLYADPFEHVLSLTLDGKYQEEGVRKTVEDFLRSKFPKSSISATLAQTVTEKQIDVRISHSGYVSDICEAFAPVTWILGVITKPLTDFGFPIALV